MSDLSRSAPRRRDPERTRAGILAAATEEFARHGLAGASVNDIALAAGVNKRMLYHYFESKDGLWLAALENACRALAERIAALDLRAGPPAEAVAALAGAVFDHVAERPEFVRLVAIEDMADGGNAARSRLLPGLLAGPLAALAAALTRGRAAGAFRDVSAVQLFVATVGLATAAAGPQPTLWLLLGRTPAGAGRLADRRQHTVEAVLATLAA